MNAFLAGFFVTSAWVCLAYSAAKGKHNGSVSKVGFIVYALGTFAWSLKGLELEQTGLVLIAALQTIAVVAGIILL